MWCGYFCHVVFVGVRVWAAWLFLLEGEIIIVDGDLVVASCVEPTIGEAIKGIMIGTYVSSSWRRRFISWGGLLGRVLSMWWGLGEVFDE